MMILSGMKPDGTGVGRLMSCLVQEAAGRPHRDVRIVCRQSYRKPFDLLCRGRVRQSVAAWHDRRQWQRLLDDPAVRNAEPLVLIQPLALGAAWCEKLIESRRLPTWLYAMDSSFFCLRSYNHIDAEHAACTRCLGGRFQWAAQLGCRPWPVVEASTGRFLERLRNWIAAGQVRCLVQNERQAVLIQSHCGGTAIVQVVGLWSADRDATAVRPATRRPEPGRQPRIVFHGVSLASQGALWAIEVARQCPQMTFLFPFQSRQLKLKGGALPDNVRFVSLTWETGLADEVAAADVVLVPSLWSATMEGALLQSIIAARAVAVVDEPTAFSSELPPGLVLRLPGDPCQAAQQLKAAVADGWTPSASLWTTWKTQFERGNRNVLGRLVAACTSQRMAA